MRQSRWFLLVLSFPSFLSLCQSFKDWSSCINHNFNRHQLHVRYFLLLSCKCGYLSLFWLIFSQCVRYYDYYLTLLRVFHKIVSWWFSLGVWMTASRLKSPSLGYSGRSQHCSSLDGLHLSSYFQILKSLYQFFYDYRARQLLLVSPSL